VRFESNDNTVMLLGRFESNNNKVMLSSEIGI